MRKEMTEGIVAIKGNCGNKSCQAKDVLFQVIKSWGMICVVICPNCKTKYNVDLRKIMAINQLG